MQTKNKHISNLYKRITSFLLAFIMLISGINLPSKNVIQSEVLAAPASSGTLNVTYLPGWIRLSGGFYQQASRITINGLEVFCIDPHRVWAKGKSYQAINPYTNVQTIIHGSRSTVLTAEKIRTFELATYYGFYSQPSNRTKVLTQALVFDLLYGRSPLEVGSYTAEYKAHKASVLAKISAHKDNPSFHGNTIQLKPGETITLTDTNNVIQNLNVPSTVNGFKFSVSGNKLTITAPNNESANTYYRFNSKTTGPDTTVFLNPGSQTTAYGNAAVKFLGGLNLSVKPDSAPLSIKKVAENKKLTDLSKYGYSLKGAEYGVYSTQANAMANKNRLGVLITDANGVSNKLQLKPGDYYLKEIKAPRGFHKDPLPHKVTLTSSGKVATLNEKPKFDPLDLMLKKVDAANTDKGLAGAEFTVKYYDGIHQDVSGLTPVRTWVFKTNENGYLLFDNRYKVKGDEIFVDESGEAIGLVGTYEFIETKAPAGFILDSTPRLAYVKDKGEGLGTIYNMPIVSNESAEKELQIVKIDSDTKKEIAQAGVIFELLNSNKEIISMTNADGVEMSQFTTDKNGKVVFPEKVLPGTYYLKEVKAPSGYYLDPNGALVEIEILEGDTKVIIKEVENTPQKGQLILNKTASLLKGVKANEKDKSISDLVYEDGFLAGTKWELKAAEQIVSKDGSTILYNVGDVVDTITTTSTGVVKSKLVPLGKYTLQEISAPKGYLVDKTVYNIEFTEKGQEVHVDSKSVEAYNERKELKFEFNKSFEDTDLFTVEPKATFGLFLAEDYIENGVTVKKDTLLDKVTIDVNNITEEVTEKEVNGTKEVTEEITKYDITTYVEEEVEDKNKPIIETKESITYEITLEDGTVKTFNTREEAKSYIDSLVAEKAPVEETQSKFSPKIKEVTNSEDVIVGYKTKVERKVSEVLSFNTLEEKDAKVAELNESGTIYKIKEFVTTVTKEVEDTENKVIEKVTSRTAKGSFKDILIDGKFYIKEIATSNQYVLDDTKHETGFDFKTTDKKENTVIGADIENKLIKATLDVTKLETGSVEAGSPKYVAGAKYILIATDPVKGETVVGEYYTDKNGKIVVDGLPKGHYIFKEVESPEGYFLNEEVISLDLTNETNGSIYEITVNNEKEPEIKTTASDLPTGKSAINPTKLIQIIDVVKYKDLIIGKEYELIGYLMDKETNSKIIDANGEVISSSIKFTPEERNGLIELIFTVDAEILRGKTTVVFEDLYRDGKLVATHSDLEDLGQTVYIKDPKIGTKLAEVETGIKAFDPVGIVKLEDIVEYKDLVIGEEYTLKLVLMDKNTGKPALIDGNEIVGFKTFIAKTTDGTVSVPVSIDLSKVRGLDLVAFEELSYKGEILAEHKDINDENQTVEVKDPKIGTKFADVNGNKEVNPSGVIEFIDHISYTDVIPGKEYEAKLVVMNKETNEPLLNANSEVVTATAKFIPESSNGKTQVSVKIDTSVLRGKELVAFEEVSRNGVVIASHKDINDEGQTVRITNPEVGTQAKWENGKKVVVEGGTYKLIDTVEYKGLVPNQEYTATGWIVTKDSKSVVTEKVSVKFTPKEANGTVDVVFEINTENMGGVSLVAFEELYDAQGNLLAEHKDINDEGQTVSVERKPEVIKTGIDLSDPTTLAISAGALALAAFVLFVAKKKKEQE